MADNEIIAALAAALDGVTAGRNWYRAAWLEAFRERDELRSRLDSLKESEDTTSAALANMHARCESRDNLIAKYRRELAAALDERDRAETELEHAKNSLAVVREDNIELSNELSQARNRIFSLEWSQDIVRKQRDELHQRYQADMEYAERFGVG